VKHMTVTKAVLDAYAAAGGTDEEIARSMADQLVRAGLILSHVTEPGTRPGNHELPRDWKPSAADAAYARDHGLDPQRVAQDFCSYWHSISGARARKHDWSMTWQMWCRRTAERAPRQPGLALATSEASGLFPPRRARIAAVDPPEAWEPLAEKMGKAVDGSLHPEVRGVLLDVTALEICRVTGLSPTEPRGDWSVLVAWIKDGLSDLSDGFTDYLVPELARICARAGYQPPSGLAYFTPALKRNWR
jgi:hypothetical protein